MKKIKLYIIDDHEYFIKGIISSIETNHDKMKVVGSSNDCREALVALSNIHVDVILLDIIMPGMNGIECCREIKIKYPEIKVIAITGTFDTQILLKIWLEKVDGILSKTCKNNELERSIYAALENRRPIGSEFPSFFHSLEKDKVTFPKLTKSEENILKLLAADYTRKEIADKLNRTQKLVDFHCMNMIKKFGTKTIKEVIDVSKANLGI